MKVISGHDLAALFVACTNGGESTAILDDIDVESGKLSINHTKV